MLKNTLDCARSMKYVIEIQVPPMSQCANSREHSFYCKVTRAASYVQAYPGAAGAYTDGGSVHQCIHKLSEWRDQYLYLRKAGGRAQPTVDIDSAEKLFEWRLLVIPVLQQQC